MSDLTDDDIVCWLREELAPPLVDALHELQRNRTEIERLRGGFVHVADAYENLTALDERLCIGDVVDADDFALVKEHLAKLHAAMDKRSKEEPQRHRRTQAASKELIEKLDDNFARVVDALGLAPGGADADTVVSCIRLHRENTRRMGDIDESSREIVDVIEQAIHASRRDSCFTDRALAMQAAQAVAGIVAACAARAASKERVREVVIDACLALLTERKLYIVKPYSPTIGEMALEAYGHGKACDAAALLGDDLQAVLAVIAARVVDQLAAPAVPDGRGPTDKNIEIDRVARILMNEWERVEKRPVNVSHIATFADMARAAVADRDQLATPADRKPSLSDRRAAHGMSEPSPEERRENLAAIVTLDRGHGPEPVSQSFVSQQHAERLDKATDKRQVSTPCQSCGASVGELCSGVQECSAGPATPAVLSVEERAAILGIRDLVRNALPADDERTRDVQLEFLDRLLTGSAPGPAVLSAEERESVVVRVPVDLVESVASALQSTATHYRNDAGHSPEGIAELQAEADQLDAIAFSLFGAKP